MPAAFVNITFVTFFFFAGGGGGGDSFVPHPENNDKSKTISLMSFKLKHNS